VRLRVFFSAACTSCPLIAYLFQMRGGSCELGALPSTGTSQPMMPGTMANHISDSDNDNDTQPEDIGDENKQGGVTKWKGVRQGKGTRKVGKASDSSERFSFPASLTGALFFLSFSLFFLTTLPMHTIAPFHASASCYACIIETLCRHLPSQFQGGVRCGMMNWLKNSAQEQPLLFA
jgi:hypothetical protein